MELETSRSDRFIVTFSQFYLLLLKITQIVYSDLYIKDETVAFNKFLLVSSGRR